MTPSTTVQAFAYAALKQADSDKDAAIAALDLVLSGQYESAISGAGRVMTVATATNKSFTYTLPPGFGPKEITDLTFEAIRLLKQYDVDELEDLMFRKRGNTASLRFC